MLWFPQASPRRARLSLESLDGRFLPDATPITVLTATPIAVSVSDPSTELTLDFSTTTVTAAPVAAAVAPQITSFGAAEVATGWYLFTGTVTAQNPAGLVVTLGGAPGSLAGVTATVQADGTFSVLVQMKTDGSDDGTATAVFSENGVQSNIAMTYVSPSQ